MSNSTEVEHMTVTSLTEFLDDLSVQPHFIFNKVFRGVSHADYKLIPSLCRLDPGALSPWPYRVIERHFIQIYKRHSRRFLERDTLSDLELLAYGQHNGLPTRLLDWSESPVVAAYFAVVDVSEKAIQNDAAIWVMKCGAGIIEMDMTMDEVREIDKLTFMTPNHIHPRVTAQRGLFSIHPILEENEIVVPPCVEELSLLGRGAVYLKKYTIPAENRIGVRLDIDKLGITPSSIMPDLDGLAKDILWDHEKNVRRKEFAVHRPY